MNVGTRVGRDEELRRVEAVGNKIGGERERSEGGLKGLEARNGGVEVWELEQRSLSEPLSQTNAEEGQEVLATEVIRGVAEGSAGFEAGVSAIRSVPRDCAHVADIQRACRSVRGSGGGGSGSGRSWGESRERKNCEEGGEGDGSGFKIHL